MSRHKWLSVFRMVFSFVGMFLILSETVWGTVSDHLKVTGWALIAVALTLITWGLDKYLDREPGGLLLLGAGVFIALTVVFNGHLLRL